MFWDNVNDFFDISDATKKLCKNAEANSLEMFKMIDDISSYNQCKVLSSMTKNKLSDIHFASSTGYGYNDIGRDVLEQIYADVFCTEDALVRPQIVSGTHALKTALFGILRHGDELLSPVGSPYDTLQGVIGIRKTKGSLAEHGVVYKQVDLLEDESFDYENIKNAITDKTKMVLIQRSKGYTFRHSLRISEIKELISFIKNINKNIIIMVDNCYGEFVEKLEPSQVGADLTVGSLIKNAGGGLAPVGGYIAGSKDLIELCASILYAPGLAKEVGPTLGLNGVILQGLFLSPSVVASSLKTAILTASIMEDLGYETCPKSTEIRTDIVQAVKLLSEEKVVRFCKGVQMAAPVDSFAAPEGSSMPGYDCPVIMAAGTFVQGSSIEFSADSPLKHPYIVFLQGGLTFEHGRIGVALAIEQMLQDL